MFSFQNKQENEEKQWKKKQIQYQKQSARKDRQKRLQSKRYLNFMEVIDWQMSIQSFRNKIENVYNYYTLLNTLFAISQEVNWRLYIEHMKLLVSSFHNMMFNKNGTTGHDLNKITDFQRRFEKLFLLKDLTLHKHLMLLLKMLLALNGKFQFMKQTTFAQILAQSAIYNDTDTIAEVLWTMTQIQVSSSALIKLIKQESLSFSIQKFDHCLLPLLTIIANFISNPNQNPQVVEQLITSTVFQKAFQLGLLSKKLEIVNQTVLIFNNALCLTSNVRNILLKQNKIISIIMSTQCLQKKKSQQILTLLGIYQKNVSNGF